MASLEEKVFIAGYEGTVGDDGHIEIDSLDGRIWEIIPSIVVTRHSDGVCGRRSACSFLAGGGKPHAKSVEDGLAMCPEELEFTQTKLGVWTADDGESHSYSVCEDYRVTCNGVSVKGNFKTLQYARNAVARLIGTAYGY